MLIHNHPLLCPSQRAGRRKDNKRQRKEPHEIHSSAMFNKTRGQPVQALHTTFNFVTKTELKIDGYTMTTQKDSIFHLIGKDIQSAKNAFGNFNTSRMHISDFYQYFPCKGKKKMSSFKLLEPKC